MCQILLYQLRALLFYGLLLFLFHLENKGNPQWIEYTLQKALWCEEDDNKNNDDQHLLSTYYMSDTACSMTTYLHYLTYLLQQPNEVGLL